MIIGKVDQSFNYDYIRILLAYYIFIDYLLELFIINYINIYITYLSIKSYFRTFYFSLNQY